MSFISSPQSLVLTVNRRLAAYLTRCHDTDQINAGNQSWVSPAILPMGSWLKSLWLDNLEDERCLLTPFQESVLWTWAFKAQTTNFPFIQSSLLISKMQKAWEFLNQWGIPLSDLKQYPLDEAHHVFIRTVEVFEAMCHEHGRISSCQIPSLIKKINWNGCLPVQISCVGFDDIYPQLAIFLKNLEGRAKIQQAAFLKKPLKALKMSRISLPDPACEIEQAAYWARQKIQINPGAEVGCVFLSFSGVQEKVRQIFDHVFSDCKEAFNFSLGKPLAQYPVIKSAMMTLSFCCSGFLERSELCQWLYSPFFTASESEMQSRLCLAARFQEEGAHWVEWSTLLSILLKPGSSYSPKLAAALGRLKNAIQEIREKKQFPSQWSRWFVEQLKAMGWPGERSLNSQEHQLVGRFLDALDEFSQVSHFNEKIALADAFSLLKQLLETVLFQPQTHAESPVQVMGFLESSGRTFDCLWVGGMNDESWPSQVNPNPFIPIALQKRMHMPHACPDRELLLCRKITERFFYSANEVVFSYTSSVKDKPAMPSPFIRDVSEISASDLRSESSLTTLPDFTGLETLVEPLTLPMKPGETVRGGASILKNQATCPFKAFVQGRLGVRQSIRARSGLSQADKGGLVHKVLERFWRLVKNQRVLLGLDQIKLKLMLEEMLEEKLNQLVLEKPWFAQSLWIEVEKKRVLSLLLDWLELEKKRDFFEVAAIEKTSKIQFREMSFSVRMDRIDRLSASHYALIDYKTGKISLTAWKGERPDDPQLPFYCIMGGDDAINAVAFAQIHVEGVAFKGFSQHEESLPGVKLPPDMSWDEWTFSWKKILNGLLTDFYEGVVRVDPKNGKQTCQDCGFQSLCRVRDA